MLLDPHASSDQQWSQKQHILNQLSAVASLPLDASGEQITARQQLQSTLNQYIYHEPFDPICGGLWVEAPNVKETHKYFCKPLLTNLYICEILMVADQVFYTGEFSFIASKIVTQIYELPSSKKNGLITTELQYSQHQLSNYFLTRDLLLQLDQNERSLLAALMNIKKLETKENHIINFKCSLGEATDKISMQYKHAQILEHSFINKLKEICKEVNLGQKTFFSNPTIINCEVIVSLSICALLTKEEHPSRTLKLLLKSVVELALCHEQPDIILLDVIYACIIFLQVEFNLEVIEYITKLSCKLNTHNKTLSTTIVLNNKQQLQVALANQFSKKINKKLGSRIERILTTDEQSRSVEPNRFQLVFLDQNDVDLSSQIVNIQSKYDHRRFVYSI